MTDKHLPTKDEIIGASLANLKDLVIQFAEKGKNILMVGPSGTGKELFARLYKEASNREIFAPINCAGISDTILHSELFGHVKGSFTGAIANRNGLLVANIETGVIFLDEIGYATQSFQAALLRVLETGDYKPFGGDVIKKINADNARIIAATANLENVKVEIRNRFTVLYIPELPVWKEEIPELIKRFCEKTQVKYISQSALEMLEEYSWPGNVRELKKLLDQAVTLCEIRKDETLLKNDFPTISFNLNEPSDNSRKKRIENLSATITPLPHEYFFLHLERPRQEPLWGKGDEGMAAVQQLASIVSALSNISTAIRGFSGKSLEKRFSSQLSFENTIPDEFKDGFWEYHAEKGRGGTELVKLFGGRIRSNKTASRLLREAKKKIADRRMQQP